MVVALPAWPASGENSRVTRRIETPSEISGVDVVTADAPNSRVE